MPTGDNRILLQDPYHLVGTTLQNRYYLEEVAGAGGMSLVYRSRDLAKESLVAVKILRPDLLIRQKQAGMFMKLFQQEAKAAQSLSHPHILPVYHNGIENNVAFIVMEWLEGRSLGEELQECGRFSLARITPILRQVCDALFTAHRQRIIHLDIKPNNIFLLNARMPNEQVKVIDFGLARILHSTVGTTLSRYVGTPHYSAPEVFQNKASHLSDIYSLAVTTFEMLTGSVPFSQSQIYAVIYQHLEQRPPSVRRANPEVPELADELIQRAMSKRPAARPQSAREFYDEFLRAQKGIDIFPERQKESRITIYSALPPVGFAGREVVNKLVRLVSGLGFLKAFLQVIFLISLVIFMYPFPQWFGVNATRAHGAIVLGITIFLLSLTSYRATVRYVLQNLMLAIGIIGLSIVVDPTQAPFSQMFSPNLSRVKGGIICSLAIGFAGWFSNRKLNEQRATINVLKSYRDLPIYRRMLLHPPWQYRILILIRLPHFYARIMFLLAIPLIVIELWPIVIELWQEWLR